MFFIICFADVDGDGIDDEWTKTTTVVRATDSDGDGQFEATRTTTLEAGQGAYPEDEEANEEAEEEVKPSMGGHALVSADTPPPSPMVRSGVEQEAEKALLGKF